MRNTQIVHEAYIKERLKAYNYNFTKLSDTLAPEKSTPMSSSGTSLLGCFVCTFH